jgi:hypothetical protein
MSNVAESSVELWARVLPSMGDRRRMLRLGYTWRHLSVLIRYIKLPSPASSVPEPPAVAVTTIRPRTTIGGVNGFVGPSEAGVGSLFLESHD